MGPIDNVPYEQFLEPLRPLLDTVHQFLREVQRVMNQRAGTPDASAPMIDDIASERPYVGTDTIQQPIESIAMASGMSCFAAQDSLLSLVRLIETGPPPPLFAGDVLCRSAIDASRAGWWLTEPAIGTDQRVRRLFLELRYSAVELEKVTSDAEISSRGAELRRKLDAYGAERSWLITSGPGGAAQLDGLSRPTVRQFLTAEFGDSAAAHAVWASLSAVTHGTQHGLVNFVDRETDQDNRGIVGTSTVAIGSRLVLAAETVVACCERHLIYMGWMDSDVSSALVAVRAELTAWTLAHTGT